MSDLTFVEYEELDRERVEALLRDLGVDERLIDTAGRNIGRVRDVITRFRAYAQSNPGVVLGALSALVAGGAVAAGAAVRKTSSKKSRKKAPAKKAAARKRSKSSSKRTLIEPHPGDKRYIRRDARGRIKESDDVGRSLAADRRRHSKTKAKPGRGDKGDR